MNVGQGDVVIGFLPAEAATDFDEDGFADTDPIEDDEVAQVPPTDDSIGVDFNGNPFPHSEKPMFPGLVGARFETKFQIASRENRVKWFRIDRRLLIHFLVRANQWPAYLEFAKLTGVPDDAVVEQVRDDWHCRRSLLVLVVHPSFPVVADGSEVPIEGGELGVSHAVLVRENDGRYRVV